MREPICVILVSLFASSVIIPKFSAAAAADTSSATSCMSLRIVFFNKATFAYTQGSQSQHLKRGGG